MTDLGSLSGRQPGQRFGHCQIQRQCTLTATDHQQAKRTLAPGIPNCRCRDCGYVFANRITHGFRDNTGIKTAREGLQHNPGKTRQKTVSKAGGRILLMNDERPTGQPGSEAAWSGDEATHAQNCGRAATPDNCYCLHESPAKLKRRYQHGEDPLAPQTLNADPLHIDTSGRYDARFKAAVRTQPDDILIVCLQRPRNCQRRVNMSASAAGHNKDRSGHVAATHRFTRRLRFTGLESTDSSW
jgi:hypothetical protein